MASESNLFSFIVTPDLGLTIEASSWFLLLITIAVLVIVLYWILFRKSSFNRRPTLEVSEVEISFGNTKVKLVPNDTDRQIAYAIWVELNTRKIGLPIDSENDVIVEVYNSWYVFFGILRDLTKEIPVSKLRQGDTEKLVEFVFSVLNDGLRPHLTTWQAKFRWWYRAECKNHPKKTPQEIQRAYPEYQALIDDMLSINKNLIKYRDDLKKLLQ